MKKIKLLLPLALALMMLVSGCGQTVSLPEWLPEGCQSWRVDQMSVTIFTNGEQSETQGVSRLCTPEGFWKTYRYNPRDGLRAEDASVYQPGNLEVRQVLNVFAFLAEWMEEQGAVKAAQPGGISYSYVSMPQSTLAAIQAEQARILAEHPQEEGQLGYFYTFSLSAGEITPLTAPFEGSLEKGVASIGFYGGEHMVTIPLID